MSVDIVIGLGYGDEGKGRVVDHLATKDSLVIRFNGGHQAGHTVVTKDHRHVFSSIGSGTLQGASTFISKYCTFYPPAFLNEFKSLKDAGYNPRVWLDSEAMLTTPFDVEINKQLEKGRGRAAHGSVGVGFGSTIGRHKTHKIFARDMAYPDILREKLRGVHTHYYSSLQVNGREVEQFIVMCKEISEMIGSVDEHDLFSDFVPKDQHVIFEGAQGVMLDMDYGFFPYVTRSHTTSRNAIELIKKYLSADSVTMNYVTRAYSTRHGNGPFSELPIKLKNTEKETNVANEWQGTFRTGALNLDNLSYAVDCDRVYSGTIELGNSRLFVTCMDQLDEELSISPLEIGKALGVREKWTSYSPGPEPLIRERH